jgi:hypothetical protein
LGKGGFPSLASLFPPLSSPSFSDSLAGFPSKMAVFIALWDFQGVSQNSLPMKRGENIEVRLLTFSFPEDMNLFLCLSLISLSLDFGLFES